MGGSETCVNTALKSVAANEESRAVNDRLILPCSLEEREYDSVHAPCRFTCKDKGPMAAFLFPASPISRS